MDDKFRDMQDIVFIDKDGKETYFAFLKGTYTEKDIEDFLELAPLIEKFDGVEINKENIVDYRLYE